MAEAPPKPQHRNPYLANTHWGQIGFGAAAALLAVDLYGRVTPWTGFTLPIFLEASGLLVLLLAFRYIYLPNMYRHGVVPDYSLKCRSCLGPVNRYSEFCEHCGFDLIYEEALIQCPKCEVELYEGTKHCPECGHRMPQKSGKKGKGKKKSRAEPAPEPADEGWDQPLDAGMGPKPWER